MREKRERKRESEREKRFVTRTVAPRQIAVVLDGVRGGVGAPDHFTNTNHAELNGKYRLKGNVREKRAKTRARSQGKALTRT